MVLPTMKAIDDAPYGSFTKSLPGVLQGRLAHKKAPVPRTTKGPYAWALWWTCGGDAIPYERGTPVFASHLDATAAAD